jgi:hypothetical protein
MLKLTDHIKDRAVEYYGLDSDEVLANIVSFQLDKEHKKCQGKIAVFLGMKRNTKMFFVISPDKISGITILSFNRTVTPRHLGVELILGYEE